MNAEIVRGAVKGLALPADERISKIEGVANPEVKQQLGAAVHGLQLVYAQLLCYKEIGVLDDVIEGLKNINLEGVTVLPESV